MISYETKESNAQLSHGKLHSNGTGLETSSDKLSRQEITKTCNDLFCELIEPAQRTSVTFSLFGCCLHDSGHWC